MHEVQKAGNIDLLSTCLELKHVLVTGFPPVTEVRFSKHTTHGYSGKLFRLNNTLGYPADGVSENPVLLSPVMYLWMGRNFF